MPMFTLKTLDGAEASPETYKGKILLVDFWVTWCKSCVETMPALQKLYDKYVNREVVVLGVSIDEKGAKVVKPFIEKRKFTYPILLDGGDKPDWQQFGVRGVPTLYLVNSNGEILRQWSGKPDKKEVGHFLGGFQ